MQEQLQQNALEALRNNGYRCRSITLRRRFISLTTNLDLPEWHELLQKKTLVDALLDRLQHHCITIRIDGPSLRSPDPPPTAAAVPSRSPRRAAVKQPTSSTQ
jgi:hypothetical protein